MSISPRCIILTGAPDIESLSWDESVLSDRLEAPVQNFVGAEVLSFAGNIIPAPSASLAKWRRVQLEPSIGFRPAEHEAAFDQTQVMSTRDGGSAEHGDHDQLLEHSVAVINDLESSQIVPQTPFSDASGLHTTFLTNGSFTTADLTETSFQTNYGSFLSASPTQDDSDPRVTAFSGTLTDIKRIPNAEHITRMQPQTMTLNLLVGIISVSPSRTVNLRRQNAEMDIIEVTVGDETRAGFTISFWLVPVSSQKKPIDDLRKTLVSLRPGNVVLLHNVALSAFKGCVYGQSLSRRFARNSTSITVLADDAYPGGTLAGDVGKFQRVRDWTMDFVGAAKKQAPSVRSGQISGKHRTKELPPDTQGSAD